ncbi:hypothetical protein ACFYPB_43950 [Streptomyces olivaceoviridis]|uniref:hypothetical protein n=1 Tax=Streptomyces olivaceoviridis TaxID=1921 RepID=UPI00367A2ED0
MARVVGVHGVGKQLLGQELLRSQWGPALADGLRRAEAVTGTGSGALDEDGLAMAFYGDLFRPPGHMLAVGDPAYTAADVQDGFELELLLAWWRSAADSDAGVAPPGGDTLVRSPRAAQTALRALSRSRFFSRIALRALVFDLKQVHRYLADPELRVRARRRVQVAITTDTRVVIAHSLGSVVAYEALCALPGHGVRALVTLGSPLGMRMIFDRLEPAPSPHGLWPGPDSLCWTNVADDGDAVAAVKDLRPYFGEDVQGAVVHNGPHAHDATAYLTDRLTGAAVAKGLA